MKLDRQSDFFRSVITLMTGTVLAQLIAFLLYPIITRIYSEEAIGELGLFARFVAFVAALATARYDFAIPITKRDHHAFTLFRLSLRIAFICLFTVLILGVCYAFFQPNPTEYFIYIVLAVGCSCGTVWINVGTNWAIRKKAFRSISNQRVVNAVGLSVFRILFGWFNWGAFGILLGTFLGTILSGLVFIVDFFKQRTTRLTIHEKRRMRVLAKSYKEFPRMNLPHTLLDLGVDWILAMSVAFYFDKGQLGQYSHAFLMLKLPLTIFGQSIGQVFFSKASEMVNEGKSIMPITLNTVKTLLLVSIVPFGLIAIFGGDVFAFIFGENWRESGVFAQILVPYLFFNFLLSPISTIPVIMGRQKEMFMIGILVAIIQLISFVGLPYLNFSLRSALWINSVSLSVLLIGVFFVYLQFVKKGRVNG